MSETKGYGITFWVLTQPFLLTYYEVGLCLSNLQVIFSLQISQIFPSAW